jgi:hypothetical protein
MYQREGYMFYLSCMRGSVWVQPSFDFTQLPFLAIVFRTPKFVNRTTLWFPSECRVPG